MPPIICLKNEFAFIKAYIEPIYINFENVSPLEKVIEKITTKIIETNDWTNNNVITDFIQDLKIHDVELFSNVVIANGVNNTNTFIITYLNAYENNKFNKLTDVKLFITPSKEKIFNESSIKTVEFIFIINCSKLILVFKTFSPTSLIEPEIK